MFDPGKTKRDKEEKAQKAKTINTLRDWTLSIIPLEHQEGLNLDIREVICGDPSCAPIDTVFTMIWPAGKGLFSLPLAPGEVTQDELIDSFPVSKILSKYTCILVFNFAESFFLFNFSFRMMKRLGNGGMVKRLFGLRDQYCDLILEIESNVVLDLILSKAS